MTSGEQPVYEWRVVGWERGWSKDKWYTRVINAADAAAERERDRQDGFPGYIERRQVGPWEKVPDAR